MFHEKTTFTVGGYTVEIDSSAMERMSELVEGDPHKMTLFTSKSILKALLDGRTQIQADDVTEDDVVAVNRFHGACNYRFFWRLVERIKDTDPTKIGDYAQSIEREVEIGLKRPTIGREQDRYAFSRRLA